jgi:hypothetical protein
MTMRSFNLRFLLTPLLLICLALVQPYSAEAAKQCQNVLLSGTVPADATSYSDFAGTWGNSTSANLIKFAPGTRIYAKATHNHPANVYLIVGVGAHTADIANWEYLNGPSPTEIYITAPAYPNPDPLSGGYWYLLKYEVIGWYYLGRDGIWHGDGTVAYTLYTLDGCP